MRYSGSAESFKESCKLFLRVAVALFWWERRRLSSSFARTCSDSPQSLDVFGDGPHHKTSVPPS